MMDRKQVQHDLALAYAKTKLQITLSREGSNSEAVDEPVKAAHSLLGWYRSCMYELAEIKDEDFLDFYAAGLE